MYIYRLHIMVSLTTDHYICTSSTSTFLAFHDSKHYYATFVKSSPCHNTNLFLPIGYKHLFLLYSLPHSIVNNIIKLWGKLYHRNRYLFMGVYRNRFFTPLFAQCCFCIQQEYYHQYHV